MHRFTSTNGLSRPDSPTKQSESRYLFLINNCLDGTDTFNKITTESLSNIEELVNFKFDLTQRHVKTFQECIQEAHLFQEWSIKKSVMDYILKDENEQKRLGIQMKNKVTCLFKY